MNLFLLTPAALAALLALLVPLALHLARRPRQRTVDFAALRWIAAVQRPQRRLVFEERLLLALRLLLLAVLALLLAGPALGPRQAAGEWVAVVPGADLARVRSSQTGGDARWVWLAPGFPDVGEPMPAAGPSASLLRELDASLPAQARLGVVVPETLQGLDGTRLALGREVAWTVAGDPARRVPPRDAETPTLAVRHPAERGASVRHLAASVAAWQVDVPATSTIDAAADDTLPPEAVDTLVWLHAGPVPEAVLDWVAAGRTLVLEGDGTRPAGTGAGVAVWRSEAGEVLAHASRHGSGRIIALSRPLQPDALPELLDPEFPERLLEVLLPPASPAAAPATAHAPLRLEQAPSGGRAATGYRALAPRLAIALALLVLMERILATRTTRWAA